MGASRTSNKDILEAIEAQTAAISNLVTAISGTVAAKPAADTPVDTGAVVEENKPSTLRVKPEYMTHMRAKAQDHANTKGETVILYGRVNLAGEHKLAYCLGTRWPSLRDKGLIGAVAQFDPS